MIPPLHSIASIIARLATFASEGWSGRSHRGAPLSLADLFKLTIVQAGTILAAGAVMCMLAAISAITLKWLL